MIRIILHTYPAANHGRDFQGDYFHKPNYTPSTWGRSRRDGSRKISRWHPCWKYLYEVLSRKDLAETLPGKVSRKSCPGNIFAGHCLERCGRDGPWKALEMTSTRSIPGKTLDEMFPGKILRPGISWEYLVGGYIQAHNHAASMPPSSYFCGAPPVVPGRGSRHRYQATIASHVPTRSRCDA